MILYHGSTMEVSQPRILKSEIGRDFCFSFYTTDIQAQAERWAKRRAMIERRRTKTKVQAIVSVYEWDEDAAKQLRFLQLDGASVEWLDLVVPAAVEQIILTAMTLSRAKLQTTMSVKRYPTLCRGSCAKKTPSSGCGLSRSTIKSRFARKWLCARFIFRTAISAGV